MEGDRTKTQLLEELERSTKLLETVSGGITDQILLLSSDLQVLWANQAALWGHGFRELQEVTGSYCYQISHHCDSPCSDPLHPCPIPQARKTGRPATITHTHVDKGGNQIFVEVTASPILDEKGGIVQFVHVARDITEGKKAEEALKASEERYRNLVENAPVGIGISTVDGRAIFRNKTIAQMHGYDSVEEFLKLPSEELYCDPKDRERLLALTKEQGLVKDFEVRHRLKNGSAFWVSLTVIPQKIEMGESALLLIAQNIDDRKKAEEALKASEERYRNLIENLPVGLAVATFDGRLLQRNKELCRMLGFQSQGESLAVPVLETYSDPEDRRRFFEVAKAGPVKDYEVRRRRKDGSAFWCSLTAVPHKTEIGEPANLVIIQDISERKRAEEALKASEERYRNLVDNAPVGIGITTVAGRPVFRNTEITRMYGYESVEELLKVPDQERYYDPEDRERLLALIREQGLVRDFEVRLKRKDGSVFRSSLTAVSQKIETGEPALLFVTQDITERKQAEEEVQHGVERLRKAMTDTVQAMSRIAEVRDPYTAGHQRRVAQLSLEIAKELGFSGERLEVIGIVALIHDIGKIHVPAEILSKPGKLTEPEFSMIKSHPQVGYDIIKGIDFPWPVAQMVLQHHERMDGSGYPAGLQRTEISPEARILAVADVVEAMYSHRPYRAALGIGEALKELERGKTTLYDADVVDACVRLFTEKLFRFTEDGNR